MAPRIQTLRRAWLPQDLFDYASPAYPHSRRLAVHVASETSVCTAYLASGVHLYGVKVILDGGTVVQGKESLLVPAEAQGLEAWRLNHFPHHAEIQGVALTGSCYDGGLLVGSVDSYGCLMVSHLDVPTKGYTVVPQDAGVGEGGWAGVVFAARQPSLAVVARGLAKSIDMYDKDIHVHTLCTLQQPTALEFLQGGPFGSGFSSTLAVTEGSELTVWDLRASERGGCIQRAGAHTGQPLYAVCCASNGLVATGGGCRTVTVIEPRRWSALSRWTNCLKYEITGLSFSAIDTDYIYVHGLDSEMVCGRWNVERGIAGYSYGFRGDSRWLSLEKSAEADVFVGWCESGSIFVGEAVLDTQTNLL